jgi:hypothetical protein
MNATQKRIYQSLLRVDSFLHETEGTAPGAEPAEPDGLLVEPHREALARLVDRIGRQAMEQDATVRLCRTETKRRHGLMRELRLWHMRPIAEVARATLDETMSTRETALRMPRRRMDAMGLVAAAGAMAQAAAPHRALLVRQGLPADFIERLERAAAAVQRTLVARSEQVARRAGATAGVAADLRQGRRLVRLVDAFMARRLDADPVRLAEWKNVKRLAQGRGARAEAA